MFKCLLILALFLTGQIANAGINNLINPWVGSQCSKDTIGLKIIGDSSIPDSQPITVIAHPYFMVHGFILPTPPETDQISFYDAAEDCVEILGLNLYHVQAIGISIFRGQSVIPNCSITLRKPEGGWAVDGGYTGVLRISKDQQDKYVCHHNL